MKLVLKNLCIGYSTSSETVEILRDINGCINSGEFICLLGPNGAGKTTLLRTLSGLLAPLGGELLLGDNHLSSIPSRELSREIGIVLTERPAVSSMTVRQLVGLGRSPYTGFWGRLSVNDEREVSDALALTNTTYLQDREVASLSDGECQRVMIARVIAQETSAIFLDESTAFLDFPGKVSIMILLKKLARVQKKAIMLSTHDLNIALALADNIWIANRDNGIISGSPAELAENGILQKYFKGEGIRFDKQRLEFAVDMDK